MSITNVYRIVRILEREKWYTMSGWFESFLDCSLSYEALGWTRWRYQVGMECFDMFEVIKESIIVYIRDK